MLNSTLINTQAAGDVFAALTATVSTGTTAAAVVDVATCYLGNGGVVLGDARGVTQGEKCAIHRTIATSPIARTRSAAIAAWSPMAPKATFVPAFHDRRPLHSST